MSDSNEEKTEDAYPVTNIDLSAESRDDIVVSKHFEGCCFCKTVFTFKCRSLNFLRISSFVFTGSTHT